MIQFIIQKQCLVWEKSKEIKSMKTEFFDDIPTNQKEKKVITWYLRMQVIFSLELSRLKLFFSNREQLLLISGKIKTFWNLSAYPSSDRMLVCYYQM